MMMDNSIMQYVIRPPAMMAQPGGRAYVIFDSHYEDNIWKIQDDMPSGTSCKRPITQDLPGLDLVMDHGRLAANDWRIGVKEAIDIGAIRIAGTLEELAGKLGLDPVKFKEAIEKWNRYCEAGVDTEFDTPARFLIPIKDAPFYGLKAGCSLGPVGCGLRVNPNMQVLDTDQTPIPGLYAAFFTAGGILGESSVPIGYGVLGGLAASTVSGYVAAEYAVMH